MPADPSSEDQKRVNAFANYCWQSLEHFFALKGKKRPPVYLYLSPQSEGSLRGRSEEERAWVHWQQAREGGMTLRKPPAAWVARADQVPEEVCHLFLLVYQKSKPPREASLLNEARYSVLHECFGRFFFCTLFGNIPQTKKSSATPKKLSEDNFWDLSHQLGYRLGENLAKLFFEEKLPASALQGVFHLNWYQSQSQGRALRDLYKCSTLRVPKVLQLESARKKS
jgi:hypothetical protein